MCQQSAPKCVLFMSICCFCFFFFNVSKYFQPDQLIKKKYFRLWRIFHLLPVLKYVTFLNESNCLYLSFVLDYECMMSGSLFPEFFLKSSKLYLKLYNHCYFIHLHVHTRCMVVASENWMTSLVNIPNTFFSILADCHSLDSFLILPQQIPNF